ncbi:liprin-beta-2-like isoform X2 [Stegodyphus dumicola]|uniref:liprin-beta-2-like isoform X2 n=1 Tax=Stegodyphus dumicola TaxID=202533 RepID=UPI0015A9DDE2|nr:liprin-beta-2-like isoform X2 [Stegodyphus dumicola]
MNSRWERRGGAPPTPPPRDPSGINSIVQQHQRGPSRGCDGEEDMSSDSSSPPRPAMDHPKRRSSYENVNDDQGFYPNKPPPALTGASRRSRESLHRSTPSPRPHVRASPCPSSTCGGSSSRRTSPVGVVRHSIESWSDGLSDELTAEPVRRRPASACRAPRSHRGSLPPVDCLGSAWGHRSPCSPCCGPSPLPYHWCGAAQTWAHFSGHSGSDSGYDCDDLQQKIYQLEVEKEQLALQVNVLTEQVEAQNEKIVELENSLTQNKEQLSNSEAQLRQEMTSRSSIESSKLDLMAQISVLRLRLASVEQEKQEIEEKNHKLENELILTCACLAEKEADLATIKSKITRNGAVTPIFENNSEVEKLKNALTSVMAANDEKEKKLQEMKTSLNRYKKLHELVLSNPTRRANDTTSKKVPFDEDNFFSNFENLSSYNLGDISELSFDYNVTEKPPPVPRQFQPHSSVSLSLAEELQRSSSRLGDISRQSPLFSPIRGESPSPYSNLNSYRYSSSENVNPPTPQKTPPAKRHYSTLPRPHGTDILQKYIKSPSESSPVAITSAPERSEILPELSRTGQPSAQKVSSPASPVVPKDKPKGFRKIFGKVKRSGSESLNSSEAEFKRGGIRATAGPRLGWTEDFKAKHDSYIINKPFSEWDSAMICDWFHSIGLGMYASECKKWVKNGDHLLKASTSDFEKELNIKNPLHRKKLLLAVTGAKEQTGDSVEPAGKIDHHWVVRWLDDIGLPQYKDAFFDARIDGRMLHHLTLEDLAHLKVTNLLHHISIKTSIQVLRENKFDAHCLKRRSLPDDENSPSDVSKWTNHRVMEWLKTVDLSEYAPNLRGSGVHGGLMLYEPRFNADLLATLLNIPPNKTLLRRHLTTQFKQLVGPDIMQKKREWEAQPSYSPLSPSAKVKAIRRSHFSLMKKKNKNELAFEDYVCPLNFSEEMCGSIITPNGSQNYSEEKFLMKEIVLKNDKILESMPASNV